VGILALLHSIAIDFKPYIQAWFKTMPPNTASAVEAGIVLGVMILITLVGLFIVSKTPDT
jgi:hypothetical protein